MLMPSNRTNVCGEEDGESFCHEVKRWLSFVPSKREGGCIEGEREGIRAKRELGPEMRESVCVICFDEFMPSAFAPSKG